MWKDIKQTDRQTDRDSLPLYPRCTRNGTNQRTAVMQAVHRKQKDNKFSNL